MNYTQAEVTAILHCVKRILPIRPDQLNDMLEKINEHYLGKTLTLSAREVQQVWSKEYPYRATRCLPEAKLAKRIKYYS